MMIILLTTIITNTIIDYYEFVHGTYQASLLNNNNIFICLESILFEKFTTEQLNGTWTNDTIIQDIERKEELEEHRGKKI